MDSCWWCQNYQREGSWSSSKHGSLANFSATVECRIWCWRNSGKTNRKSHQNHSVSFPFTFPAFPHNTALYFVWSETVNTSNTHQRKQEDITKMPTAYLLSNNVRFKKGSSISLSLSLSPLSLPHFSEGWLQRMNAQVTARRSYGNAAPVISDRCMKVYGNAQKKNINKAQPQLALFSCRAIHRSVSVSRFLRTSLSIPSVSLCGS